jgi:CheY-like chemotaxis protein
MTTSGRDALPSDPTGLKILVVDDEPMLRSVIEDFLSLLGFEAPMIAGDGRQALQCLRSAPVDCMISDIRMPEMPLEELLVFVESEFPRLQVVATSGYSDLESARFIIEKGAHDFLGKPLNLDGLEVALTWICQRRRILDRAEECLSGAPSPNGADRFGPLVALLSADTIPFAGKMRHSLRMAELARVLEGLLHPTEADLLRLAALLHELGSSYLIQSLSDQPRRLDNLELQLVHAHSRVSGRLGARRLDCPALEAIIGEHPFWHDQSPKTASEGPAQERLAIWLGLLNFIDGCMNDRPDRAAYRPEHVRDSLKRRYANRPLEPIARVLERWDGIESTLAR